MTTLGMYARWLLFGCLLATVLGCGGSGATVEGDVTLDGTPAPGAEIMFRSADNSLVVYGYGQDDGSYVVDYGAQSALPAGPYHIEVTHYLHPETGEPLPNTEEGNALKSKATKKHVWFDFQLQPGANQVDLEISEGQPVE